MKDQCTLTLLPRFDPRPAQGRPFWRTWKMQRGSFDPYAPAQGATRAIQYCTSPDIFRSAPARGAPLRLHSFRTENGRFDPRPRVRGDHPATADFRCKSRFNPRPRTSGRLHGDAAASRERWFLSAPRTSGRPLPSSPVILVIVFQSTPAYERATCAGDEVPGFGVVSIRARVRSGDEPPPNAREPPEVSIRARTSGRPLRVHDVKQQETRFSSQTWARRNRKWPSPDARTSYPSGSYKISSRREPPRICLGRLRFARLGRGAAPRNRELACRRISDKV
jgi:hypothetical protein